MEHQKIEFSKATIVSLDKYPADKEPTVVFFVHVPFTLKIAEQLKCKALFYTINDTPHKFEGKISPGIELGENQCDIRIPSFMGSVDTISPHRVWKLRVGHDGADKLGMDIRMHFRGKTESQLLNDLADEVNDETFDFAIVSLQGELFAEKASVDGNDGTRVNMSATESDDEPNGSDEDDTLCVSCENDLPLNEAGDVHLNGMRCKNAAKHAGGSSLASAVEVAGSTDALKKKRGRPKREIHVLPQNGVEVEGVVQ